MSTRPLEALDTVSLTLQRYHPRTMSRPTVIYWLQDIRPETIAAGWVQGLPFYAGKTDRDPEKRLREHRQDAQRSPKALRLLECAEHVRIVVMEVVPPDGDWAAREKHWIAWSRRMFPESMTNISDGGEAIHSKSTYVDPVAWRAAKARAPAAPRPAPPGRDQSGKFLSRGGSPRPRARLPSRTWPLLEIGQP